MARSRHFFSNSPHLPDPSPLPDPTDDALPAYDLIVLNNTRPQI